MLFKHGVSKVQPTGWSWVVEPYHPDPVAGFSAYGTLLQPVWDCKHMMHTPAGLGQALCTVWILDWASCRAESQTCQTGCWIWHIREEGGLWVPCMFDLALAPVDLHCRCTAGGTCSSQSLTCTACGNCPG